MKKSYILSVTLLLILTSLTSCVKAPDFVNKDGVIVADSESKIDNSSDSNKEVREKSNGNYTVTEQNSENIINSANRRLKDTFSSNTGKSIIIDAVVDVNGITEVGSYSYILEPITDGFRSSLFTALFGDRASNAQYDQLNDKWTLANSDAVGDYYLYEIFIPRAGATVTGEESFSIEYRNVDLYPFADNLLPSVNDSTVKIPILDVISMCDNIMDDIVDLASYKVDYIHAYGTNGRHPYYKVVYKRLLNNTVLTGFNDIYFLVDNDGIQKINGSVFSVEELLMEKQLLSVDEAMERLKSNIVQVNIDKDIIEIGKITFEYIIVNTIEGEAKPTPVWRFLIGNSNDEINLNRDKFIAVNAITGDIISDERGNTF